MPLKDAEVYHQGVLVLYYLIAEDAGSFVEEQIFEFNFLFLGGTEKEKVGLFGLVIDITLR